jgi:hypothetical protein
MTHGASSCTLRTKKVDRGREGYMKPIHIVLYAIIVTTMLTILFSQPREVSPRERRTLSILAAVGLIAFGVVVLLVSTR